MSSKIGFFDDVAEQGEQIAQKTAKHVKAAPKNAAKAALNQIAPGNPLTAPSEDSPDNKKNQPKPINPPAGSFGQALKQQLVPTAEDKIKEQAKLQKVRQELHQNYYQNLVNRPKPKEEAPLERVERQDKEEEHKKFMEQKKKEEKKLPTNMRQGTGEKQTGIGG